MNVILNPAYRQYMSPFFINQTSQIPMKFRTQRLILQIGFAMRGRKNQMHKKIRE